MTKLQAIFFILAGLSLLVTFVWIFKTEKRLKRFFGGKKGRDLEDAIVLLEKRASDLEKARKSVEEELARVNAKLKQSIRGLETIRFNPFPREGGSQSFAIGLMNEERDGVVISSLYSRDRMSIFAKPVTGGKSAFELSEEEKEVLWKAQNKIK